MNRIVGRAAAYAALAVAIGTFAADRVFAACRVDSLVSHVRVLEDGNVLVRERFVLRDGDCKRFSRRLSRRRADTIEVLRTSGEPRVLPTMERIVVRWHPAGASGPLHYEVEYRLQGALRADGATRQLRWYAAETNRAYQIGHAVAVFEWPASWPAPRVEGPRGARFERQGNTVRAARDRLGKDRTLRWEATFVDLPVAPAKPAWQARSDARRARDRVLALGALGIVVAGSGIALAMHRERSLHTQPDVRTAISGPPADLSPALAGALRRGKSELVDAVGTCVDLARRGHLSVEVASDKRWYQGSAYVIRRGTALRDPEPWERVVLSSVLASEAPSIPANEAWKRLRAHVGQFRDAVSVELRRRGAFDLEGRAARQQPLHAFALVAWLLAVGTGAAAVAMWQRIGPAMAFVPMAFAVVGSMALAVSYATPRHTALGRSHAARWNGFAADLKQVAKGHALDDVRFRSDLAYALALDVGDAWLQAGERSARAMPEWFRPLQGSGAAVRDLRAWLQCSGALASSSARRGPI